MFKPGVCCPRLPPSDFEIVKKDKDSLVASSVLLRGLVVCF